MKRIFHHLAIFGSTGKFMQQFFSAASENLTSAGVSDAKIQDIRHNLISPY